MAWPPNNGQLVFAKIEGKLWTMTIFSIAAGSIGQARRGRSPSLTLLAFRRMRSTRRISMSCPLVPQPLVPLQLVPLQLVPQPLVPLQLVPLQQRGRRRSAQTTNLRVVIGSEKGLFSASQIRSVGARNNERDARRWWW